MCVKIKGNANKKHTKYMFPTYYNNFQRFITTEKTSEKVPSAVFKSGTPTNISQMNKTNGQLCEHCNIELCVCVTLCTDLLEICVDRSRYIFHHIILFTLLFIFVSCIFRWSHIMNFKYYTLHMWVIKRCNRVRARLCAVCTLWHRACLVCVDVAVFFLLRQHYLRCWCFSDPNLPS